MNSLVLLTEFMEPNSAIIGTATVLPEKVTVVELTVRIFF